MDDSREDLKQVARAAMGLDDGQIRESLEGKRLRADLRSKLFGRASEDVRLGPYRVKRKIAQGGMGAVYETEHVDTGQPFAVKVVRTAGEQAETRLLREGKTMAKLRHANVVAVHDVGRCEEGLYIAMDYIAGPTLRHWLADAPPRETVLEFVAQAADGLAAAHALGVLHRDVKPGNILVGDDGEAKVADFGLAKSLPGSPAEGITGFTAQLTSTGAAMGTLGYMSPEQLSGTPLTTAADQFALGVTAFESLYGVAPFQGNTPDAVAIAIIQGRCVELPPEKIGNARAHAAVERALAGKAEDRHPSMAAFAAALRGRAPAAKKRWWRR